MSKPQLECTWNPKRYELISCEFNKHLIDRCRKLEKVLEAGKRMVFLPVSYEGNAAEFKQNARQMMVDAIAECEDIGK